jgi:AbiV family abortive infection protein
MEFNFPKITKRNAKRYFKSLKNSLEFYKNAKMFLNDAKILFEKKRYVSAILCTQLAFEDCGMAYHYFNLYHLSDSRDGSYQNYLKEIKENYRRHKFKIKSITDFRFRYNQEQKEFSKIFQKYFHEKRLEETYLKLNKKTGLFEKPKVTKRNVESAIKNADYYMYKWGIIIPSMEKHYRSMIKSFKIKTT